MAMLEGKTAVVTGASRGIGLGIAARFLAEGARVVLASRTPPPELPGPGRGEALWRACDVARAADVEALFGYVRDELGRLDVLVNNAGVQIEKTLAETSEEEWDRLMGINLKGLFLCSRAAIAIMRTHGGGAILNLGSIAGLVSDHAMAAYNASKAGVHGLTRSIAVDHGHEGIRCNAICPGWIMTEMSRDALALADDPAAAERKAVARHPVGRLGRPEDIAAMAAWLASDDAAFASGQLFTVDGGLTAGSPINPTLD